MPRPRPPAGVPGAIDVRRLPGGRGWRARTMVWDEAGVRHAVERTRPTRESARTACVEAARAVRPAAAPGQVPTSAGDLSPASTVGALLDLWLEEHLREGLRPQSAMRYQSIIETTIRPLLGDRTIAQCTVGLLDRTIKSVAAERPGVAYTMRSLLAMAFDLAQRHGATPANAVRSTARVPRTKPAPRALTPEQVARFHELLAERAGPTAAIGLQQTACVLVVMLGTGARIGEVLALRHQDILGRTVTLAATVVTGTDGLLWQAEPKTAAGHRRITVPEFVIMAIRRAVALGRPGGDRDLVFPTQAGGLRGPQSVRTDLQRILAGSELAGMHTHVLRQTVGTIAARATGTEAAAALLGHSGTATTRRHYVEREVDAPDLSAVLADLSDNPDEW